MRKLRWKRMGRRVVTLILSLTLACPLAPVDSTNVMAAADGVVFEEYTGGYKKPSGEGTTSLPYLIGTKEELYWFAGLVNGDEAVCKDGVERDMSANAVLTADITLNDNVLNDDGKLVNETATFTAWKGIGMNKDNTGMTYAYTGSFDGQGHTVSGVCMKAEGYATGFVNCMNKGEICNLKLEDIYIEGEKKSYSVGTICGDGDHSIVEDCMVEGLIKCGYNFQNVGGICGSLTKSTVNNCLFVGRIDTRVDNPDYWNIYTIIGATGVMSNTDNNYYCWKASSGETTTITAEEGTGTEVTAEQLKSGEVAYKLNQERYGEGVRWHQTIGTNQTPELGKSTDIVCPGGAALCPNYTDNSGKYYNKNNVNISSLKHTYNDYGMCKYCGQMNFYNSDADCYEISTAEELKNFVMIVNGEYMIDAEGNCREAEPGANGLLVGDIILNDVTFSESDFSGEGRSDFSAESGKSWSQFDLWKPMKNYYGTFDGNGHKISGLCSNNGGLFENAVMEGAQYGAVKNLTVTQSYVYRQSSSGEVGVFIGNGSGCLLDNCHVTDSVYVCGASRVGGLIGYAAGASIINCSFRGTLRACKYECGGFIGRTAITFYDGTTVVQNSYMAGKLLKSDDCSEETFIQENGALFGRVNNLESDNVYWNSDLTGLNAVGKVDKKFFEEDPSPYESARTESKTTEQFASGEVTVLLGEGKGGDVWRQNLGDDTEGDAYPVTDPSHMKVEPDDNGGYNNVKPPEPPKDDQPDKPSQNPPDKPSDKPADKPAGKPAQNPGDEPTGNKLTNVVGKKISDRASGGVYKITKIAAKKKPGTVALTGTIKKKIKTLVIPNAISYGGYKYYVTSIRAKACKKHTSLTKVVIPSRVTVIGSSAFYGCKRLADVTVGKGVRTIGSSAFYGCKKLTKVTVGKNVKTIGSSAFAGCSRLRTVTLGSRVTTIGKKAFYKCISLTKLTIPSRVKRLGSRSFYGCKRLKAIKIKTSKLTGKRIGSNAFKGIYSKATVKVPKKKLASYKKILKARGIGSRVKVKKY